MALIKFHYEMNLINLKFFQIKSIIDENFSYLKLLFLLVPLKLFH